MKHPIQPIYKDKHDTYRFKENAIVNFLLTNGGFDLNKLAMMEFSIEDREQFAQLIGYSLHGFGELSFVTDETYETAERMAKQGVTEEQAQIEYLKNTLIEVKKGLKIAFVAAFQIHPNDLESL